MSQVRFSPEVHSDVVDNEHKYYVYGHYKINSDIPFYIGKGEGRRAYSKKNRNRHWQFLVEKHGYRIEIMCQYLTEIQALDIEKEFIKRFGRADLGCGPLVNMTDGGDGGGRMAEETKLKISIAHKGKVLAEDHKQKLRVPRTETTKRRMRHPKTESHKQSIREGSIGKAGTFRGRKHTDETRIKQRAAQLAYWNSPEGLLKKEEMSLHRMLKNAR